MPSRLLPQANHPQDLQLFQCHNIPVMLTNQCLMEMFQQQITPLLNLGKMVNQRTVIAAGQKVDNQQGRELQRWSCGRAAVRATAGPSSYGKFLGAPSTRGLFLYCVAKQLNKEDITAWMGSKKINYIHIEKTSNPDAMIQSFKITVPADDYRESLDPESWPNGVYVRDFRMPMEGLRRKENNNGFS